MIQTKTIWREDNDFMKEKEIEERWSIGSCRKRQRKPAISESDRNDISGNQLNVDSNDKREFSRIENRIIKRETTKDAFSFHEIDTKLKHYCNLEY